MTELLETEEEYVKKLRHVCEVGFALLTHHNNHNLQNYIGEMEMLKGLPKGLVGKKNILFSNIELLFDFTRQ